jgi:Putative auto-transporter adhesin, head GIN domain
MKNSLSFRRGVFGLAVAGLAVAALASSNSFAALSDNDDTVTENRTLDTFTKIRIKGAIELRLVAGKDQKVTIETAADRIKDVETYLRGDTLVIDMSSKGKRNHWRNADVEVEISMRSLEGIEVMGAVEAKIKGVDSPRLEIEIKGAAELDIEGSCGDLELDIKGAGDISARDLKCENVDVDVRGAGDASIFAAESVEADVAGVASISIYGQPKKVRKHVSGLGSISIK